MEAKKNERPNSLKELRDMCNYSIEDYAIERDVLGLFSMMGKWYDSQKKRDLTEHRKSQ
jgi:hypothetical protein